MQRASIDYSSNANRSDLMCGRQRVAQQSHRRICESNHFVRCLLRLVAVSVVGVFGATAANAQSLGTVSLGSSTSQAIPVTIAAAGTVGSINVLTQGIASLDFTNATGGTCLAGNTYSIGDTCIVNVQFAPLAPGMRLGAVVLLDISGAPLATDYITGIGSGSLGSVPGIISTVAGIWPCTVYDSHAH